MKPTISKLRAVKLLMWIAASAILFSFSGDTGADSYKVYLNDKLILQQYVSRQASVPDLPLDESVANDELAIYYNHCGKIGTARNISIKDGNDQLLKEWKYTDVSGTDTGMHCSVKDILTLSKGKAKVNLYYSSKEIPDGMILASIVTKDKKTASN